MKKILLVSVLTALLGACASGVKLDTPPVEDRAGTNVTGAVGDNKTDKAGVTERAVTGVDITKQAQDRMGPSGERIVYFDYDSFVVKQDFQALLDAQAKYLKADKSRKATIEGHTDERGGREYNLALGQKRSEAVRRALGVLGVADAQVDAVSFGKEKPVAVGDDERALAKNRRAEVAYRP